MDNKHSRKLTVEDLIDIKDAKPNENIYKYGIENNQKKYSHTQKCKP